MASAMRGRVISTETDFVSDMRKRNYMYGALAVFVVWSIIAGIALAAGAGALAQVFLAAIFGIIVLYLYGVSSRMRPMVVYEYGIEYSSGLSRRFDPWNRLMYAWEDGDGLTLRRVHGIEAAMGVLDNRSEAVTLVTVPFDMPGYRQVVDYIMRVLPDAHRARGTKWRWDHPGRYR